MGKLGDKIKEEIKEEVADIIYEKAKAEIKQKIKDRYDRFIDRTLSFFGISETRRQRVRRIGEEIKDEKNLVSTDSVLGIAELFTVNYTKSIVELLTITAGAKSEEDESKKENKS